MKNISYQIFLELKDLGITRHSKDKNRYILLLQDIENSKTKENTCKHKPYLKSKPN